jgi:hypothetical protein
VYAKSVTRDRRLEAQQQIRVTRVHCAHGDWPHDPARAVAQR